MNILELRKLLLATPLAFAGVIMLPACSSTEEAPPPTSEATEEGVDCVRGDKGICCDLDPIQEGCPAP